MAVDLRLSFQVEPSRNDPGSVNLEHKPSQGQAIQGEEEEICEFPRTQLRLLQNSNNSCARQELQNLYKLFHSWLQPEKHSKDEIISRLVLEQFMINSHYSDRSLLKEKWNASDRNLEKFMEDLTDDGMKSPGLVHVHMQGQEGLFSENMPLKEVIVHLTKQRSVGSPTGTYMGTPSCTPQDTPLETGQGDQGSGDNVYHVNDSIASQGNEIPSLLIIPEEDCPRPEEDSVSWKNPLSSGRAGPGTSGSQDGSPKGPSHQEVLMEGGPGSLSESIQITPQPVPTHQRTEGSSTSGGHQERRREAHRSFRCEKCPRIFRYLSQLKAHERRHNNERTHVCGECKKGFFHTSDLRVHQRIHAGEKPFTCSTCAKSFIHKTNLVAHERIHTGEKPYECSLCHGRYRQSSTYHRHLKSHQKSAFRGAPSTPEASSGAAPME